MLKATLLNSGRGKLNQWHANDHELVQLARCAQVTLSGEEKDLLHRLSAFTKWAGRYPVPRKLADMAVEQIGCSPAMWPIPPGEGDRAVLDALFGRLADEIVIEVRPD